MSSRQFFLQLEIDFEPRSRFSSSAETVMTGCWFSRQSSLGLRMVRMVASCPSGTKPIPAIAAGLAAAGGVAVARLIGSRASAVVVEPDAVGVADANPGHPILLGDRTGDLAIERGVELRLDIELGEADAGGLEDYRAG